MGIQRALHDRHEAELSRQAPRPDFGAHIAQVVEPSTVWVVQIREVIAMGVLRRQRLDLSCDRRVPDEVVKLETAPEFRQEPGWSRLGEQYLGLDRRLRWRVPDCWCLRRGRPSLRRQLDRRRRLLDAARGDDKQTS